MPGPPGPTRGDSDYYKLKSALALAVTAVARGAIKLGTLSLAIGVGTGQEK